MAAPGTAAAAPAFTTECLDSCASSSYVLCATSEDCDNGGTCIAGPYARYCATFDGGGITFPEGGFSFPDGGFTFPRRDAGGAAAGDDGAAGDDESTADGGSD